MTDDNASNPSKKRKANDGRAAMTVGGGFLSSCSDTTLSTDQHGNSNDKFMQQTLSHMERMEQSMLRMEEKLSTLSSVEGRCKELEAKCSSLENKLDSTTQSVKETLSNKCNSIEHKISSLQSTVNCVDIRCYSLEDNLEGKVNKLQDTVDSTLEFLRKNQNWEYPVAIKTYDWLDDQDEAAFLLTTATVLKEKTIKLREGVFPDIHEGKEKAISMVADADDEEYFCDKILPHWIEFAAALMQFNPTMEQVDGTCFDFGNYQLNKPTLKLIKEALIGKPFEKMRFTHNNSGDYEAGGLSVDEILDVVGSNKHLRNLAIYLSYIRDDHVEKLCSIVQNNPLVDLTLTGSCSQPGVGDAIVANLLTRRDSKLEVLSMPHCRITSDVSTVLADFLAGNPKLKRLDLPNNDFNVSDAEVIANSLRSNTELEYISLLNNNIQPTVLSQTFRSVLFDDSSLNAAADSNHSCYLGQVHGYGSHFNLNSMVHRVSNRGRKIYFLLSSRHRTMSNTQYFDDIDVNVLPDMLEYIQRYGMLIRISNDGSDVDEYNYDVTVGCLSIVYEVMRKWDKVFCLYE